MFKMIGGDGREYGPVTAEELRAWILENRANGETLIQPDGGTDWRPLSAFPEFAEPLASARLHPDPVAPAAAELETPAGRPEPVPADRSFSVSDCLGHGWLLLGRHFFLLVGATSIVWLILTASALATCVGGLVSLVVSGALHGGLILVYLKCIRGEPASLGEVFSRFGPAFVPLMLIHIVTQLLSQLGLVFCLLPGLYLKVIWVFGLALAADRGIGFWEALELSRQTVSRRFFQVAALMAVAYLPLIVFEAYSCWRSAAFLTELLGPMDAWKLATLQSKAAELTTFAGKLALEEQLVLLLNLPFAYAALLQAYESLFGQRRAEARG